MSLLWNLIAGFLIVEIVVIFLFLLPVPSAQKWRKIFKIGSFEYMNYYMRIMVLGLVVIFITSCKDIRKYHNEMEKIKLQGETNFHPEFLQMSYSNLFRSQRNCYISGFSLILWFVLNRLIDLISSHGQLMSDHEATRKQAISATEAAKKFMDKTPIKDTKRENSQQVMKKMKSELEEAKTSLEMSNSQLITTNTELEALKSKAEETKREYDRLLNEFNQITKSDETSQVK